MSIIIDIIVVLLIVYLAYALVRGLITGQLPMNFQTYDSRDDKFFFAISVIAHLILIAALTYSLIWL